MIPSIVDWRITSKCDMNCPFCYGPKGIESMNKDNAKKVVNILHKMGVETICISGGEPLLYPYIVDIMREINEKNIKIFLSTGGNRYLNYNDKIEPYISKLSLPLDGYTSEIHSRNGRPKDNYQNVLSILDHYTTHERDFQIKIATLLTSKNINIEENLIGIYNILTDYPINLWKIYELIPEGRAIQNYETLSYSPDVYTKVTDSLNRKIKKIPLFQIVLSRRKERDLGYFIIQPDGDVIIPEDKDVVKEKILGNILIDSIEDIMTKWQGLVNYLNYLTNVRSMYRKPPLSEVDEKILFQLVREPRQSIKHLSKNIGLSEHIINERYKHLFDSGIIRNIIPIMNLDMLGFGVYLVNLTLGAIDKDTFKDIIDYLVSNPNVAWVVECSGKWSIMIAIFAKNGGHCDKILMEILNVCGDKLISYETHEVSEKYVIGQRYLMEKEKTTDFIFNRSRIYFSGKKISGLSKDDYLVLSKIRESRKASISYISRKINKPEKQVEQIVNRLQRLNILQKFEPIFDVALLGYEWYEVFIKFKNITVNKRREFINYIHSITKVVHINCTLGAWDINFEIHSENKEEFKETYNEIKERFENIISKEEFVRIYEEYKFNFLVDDVLKEGLEMLNENHNSRKS